MKTKVTVGYLTLIPTDRCATVSLELRLKVILKEGVDHSNGQRSRISFMRWCPQDIRGNLTKNFKHFCLKGPEKNDNSSSHANMNKGNSA